MSAIRSTATGGRLMYSGSFWRYRYPNCSVLCDLDRAGRAITVLHVSLH